jgi:hypothetical protein
MIQTRIKAGMDRVRTETDRNGGKFRSKKSGVARRSLGRPGSTDEKLTAASAELTKGAGIIKTAKRVGLGVSNVHKLRRDMSLEAQLSARRCATFSPVFVP